MLHKSVVLRVMRNTAYLGNTMKNEALDKLSLRLPRNWQIELSPPQEGGEFRSDALLTISSPDSESTNLVVEEKRKLTPRQASEVANRLAELVENEKAAGAIVIVEYLSELSQKRLREKRINYIDLTGNRWIALERPGLLIDTQGADKDPSPARRPIRTLKGAKAARIVRALCDILPPLGVRELARLANTDPGYTSRVLDLLYSDDLIQRGENGEIEKTNWQDLIRRWSKDYSVLKTNRMMTFLAPRGIDDVLSRLRTKKNRYALTGSFAVPTEAKILSGRLLICYVTNFQSAADDLQVRLAESGANIIFLEPFDKLVFERVRIEDEIVKVALSQCVVDLLTSSGRSPSEAEALITWMELNEERWRF